MEATRVGVLRSGLVPSGTDAYADLASKFGASVPVGQLEEISMRLHPLGAPAGTTDAFLAESRGER